MSLKTILITNNYPKEVFNYVKTLVPNGFRIIGLNQFSKQECIEKAKNADFFLVSGRLFIDKDIIDAAPNLKMIQRTGVGTDTLDLAYIKTKKIPFFVNQGVNANAVAEHTLLLILATLRKLTLSHNNTVKGIWLKNSHGLKTFSLEGKKIGLVGLGKIGFRVAELLQPFNVEIVYYKPNRLNLEIEKKLNLSYMDLKSLSRKVDILSIHCSLNQNTKGLIDMSIFKLMKSSSIIINTGRGQIINELDLIEALDKKIIGGAGLDVFDKEPLAKSNPLNKKENVICTSHIAGITKESYTKLMQKAIENIYKFDKSKTK
jgi:D-3-phosphoglycerate dehydrogenase / 2-oxoglutarate reductase